MPRLREWAGAASTGLPRLGIPAELLLRRGALLGQLGPPVICSIAAHMIEALCGNVLQVLHQGCACEPLVLLGGPRM